MLAGLPPPIPWSPASFFVPVGDRSARSHIELLVVEALVQIGDEFAVAVEQKRRPPLARADIFLACLAPARMRHLRIHVRPEPVFACLQHFPRSLRPLVG